MYQQIYSEETGSYMSYYTQENFDRTDSVGFALSKARNLIVIELDAALKELNVKAHHIGVLMALFRGTAKTPAGISRHLGVDSGLMTRLLDSLEQKELIARSRDGKDRRIVNLTLTEAGHAVALRIAEIVPGVLNARLRSFSNLEFEELSRLLGKLLT
jgi:DNA-binding MarR family transcriptional regulator